MKHVANDQAFHLELKIPNAQTCAAMEESRAMMKEHRARFGTAEALLDDLKKSSQR